jgi:hypothetical protein
VYRFLKITLLPLIFVMLHGCSTADDAQRKFEDEAFREPSGFTRTEPSGTVVEEDPDDWRVGPLFQGFVEISPAFPNPTTGELVTIEILVTGLQAVNGLEVTRLDNRGNFRLLYLDDRIPLPTGLSTITFDPLLFADGGTIANARGLHRVFIFDNRRNLVSYGDIKIE